MGKVSKDAVFSGPYFPTFGLNAGKVRTRKNTIFGHFSRSGYLASASDYG